MPSTGSDENLSTDMGMVITYANLLINLTGAAVVLTHHTGKARTGATGTLQSLCSIDLPA